MRVLRLNLKREYWEQIRDGVKVVEFRLQTPYWRKRLIGVEYEEVHLLLGYPRRGDESRIIRKRWNGVTEDRIIHNHFGAAPVDVFAIDVRFAA